MDGDNRQTLRKELRIGALLSIDGAEPVSVHTMDIAKFGMGLVGMPEQMKSGQQGLLAFDLFLDGRVQNVSVRIRVAYCLPTGNVYRAGLQFVDLESPGAKLIAHYVGG